MNRDKWNNKRIKSTYDFERLSFILCDNFTEDELNDPIQYNDYPKDVYLAFRKGILFGLQLADISISKNSNKVLKELNELFYQEDIQQ